jgi:hypothetical protein
MLPYVPPPSVAEKSNSSIATGRLAGLCLAAEQMKRIKAISRTSRLLTEASRTLCTPFFLLLTVAGDVQKRFGCCDDM